MFSNLEKIIKVKDLSVSDRDIKKYLGKNDDATNNYFLDIAKKELKKLDEEAVKVGVQFFTASLLGEKLNINNVVFYPEEEFVDYLNGAKQVAIFACTLGVDLENMLHQYSFSEEMELAFVSDILGSIIVETASGYILDKVTSEAKEKSLKTTNTLSPGNCGWDIAEQEKLFSLLPNDFLGIEIKEGGMMNPVKSISGIIGVGKKVKFKHTDCALCNSVNCAYRSV
ncbi:MAG: hypothetical protein ABFR62_11670 [Bacteroidota bacterium]